MKEDQILELGIDAKNRFFVRPKKEVFAHIYRTASGVDWAPDPGVLIVRNVRDMPPDWWFKLVWRSVEGEYGVRLRIPADVVWTGISTEVSQLIVDSLPDIEREADEQWADMIANVPARAAQMAIDSLAHSIRPQADAAFRSADYRSAAKLYAKILPALTPSEKKRLEIARARSK